jgi:Abnormal spindle-like microcephaly-assoc'd, ASPM-SPD-2-Hydin
MPRSAVHANALPARPQSTANTATWQPLGPSAVITPDYGLVTGRITALALDPSDPTGNRLFVGTTCGGVWVAQNAATSNTANISFVPLTDNLAAMATAIDASISIGALSIQPGGTGVILAGTGDPNDALDSYYGAGILRSADSGRTWSLISYTVGSSFSFLGEGFAGFAWSTQNQQLVVAAVSQAYEGLIVGAQRSGRSYEGLYYSIDSGATWSLAQITDGNGQIVQGPLDGFANPDGNAATSVVWNPVRNRFIAAVRFHGYYQSADGANWTRLDAQPGAGLTTAMCPTRPISTGSPACPIYRGTLAVNPLTGDTFAWTVDLNNQDQGIWQDACQMSGGACTNQTIAFGKQWKTDVLQADTWLGSATIQNGSYNLALAAVPSGQDTILLAGANDLWKCSLAMGCAWRNTTNSGACMSAQVGEYQHTVEWNPANPLELFVGNDSGLWRSLDGIAESGPVCSPSDASHFQNLNGALGSLADVESMSAVGATPYTMMVGLGANGTAGVKSTSGPTSQWPQILSGEGGPVAIDPANPGNWYVNNGVGVSIHRCSQAAPCIPSDFGSTPVVSNADVNGDGFTMLWPAPFIIDPLDPSQLLIGTCRIWRGPANGSGWTIANAISPMFDGNRTSPSCNGNALIRSLAAMPLAGGGEIVFAGTNGALDGGATLPGHVPTATMDANGVWSAWQDLALNPIGNDPRPFNAFAMGVSSLLIDPHDATGKTVYATIEGVPNPIQDVHMVYRSSDGGAHWYNIQSNLHPSAANGIVIDPQDANTAYLATDAGVFITYDVASCATAPACWSVFGTGLPTAPVVALSAAPASTSPHVLLAGTFGRGVWQIPLATAVAPLTTATLSPSSIDFGRQGFGIPSSPQIVTLTNTGGIALLPGNITITGDFSETDNCSGATVNAGASCTIQVTFQPAQTGSRSGQLSVSVNILGGALSVAMSGTGETPGVVNLSPGTIDFGQVEVGSTSKPLPITAENGGETPVAIRSITVSGPFVLAANSCGTTGLPGKTDCQLQVEFAPTAAGPATGALILVDDAGTQSVQLKGTGAAPPTDSLSPTSLTFAATIIGQTSAPQTVSLTNSGDLSLTLITAGVTGPFLLTNNCNTVLVAHSSCSLAVSFAPTKSGTQTGSLTITDVANKGQTVSLSGTGVLPPLLSVTPTSLTFPIQQAGSASAPATLKVTNGGGAPLANVGFQITGPAAASFSLANSDCGVNLDAGANCTLQVIFTPASSGGAAATLTISSSTTGVAPATVSLNGTGQSAAGLNVNPTQLSFPAQDLNKPSAAQAVTVSNSGATAAHGLSLSVSGPFSLAQNNCGTSLAAGASCTTGVVFTPPSRGVLSGALTVAASDLSTPATVSLSGIGGLTGAVQITPSMLNFPLTGVGATSSPITVTVANSSAAVDLDNLRLAVSSGFKTGSTTCGEQLKAGSNCTVDVSFAPPALGTQNGTLTLTSERLAASMTVPLSGMGFDFQAANSGASSQTVSSGQRATYQLSLVNSSGSPAAFSLSCGSLPSYASCVFNPSSTTVPANGTGTVTLQITTSQASSAARPLPMGRRLPLTPVFALVLLPLALRARRRHLFALLALAIALVSGLAACSSSGGGGGGAPPPPVTHTTPAGTYTIPVKVSSTGVEHIVSLTLVVD